MILENIEINLPEGELIKKINSGKVLNIKMGFDPTSPDLHLGHAVAIRKLKEFQDLGHKIIIIIGDYTALIGDPSGKDKTRPTLSAEEIEKNSKTYINQLGKILDIEKIEVRRNSEWLSVMDFNEFISLLSKYTVQQIMERNDFHDRFEKGVPISLHEIIYPLIQGYDSVKIKADVEIGGQDQLFNLLIGRYLQEKYGQEPQVAVCVPLLRGLDGVQKMSKSLKNYIGLTDSSNDIYGKTMSIKDDLIEEYLKLATSFSEEEKQNCFNLLKKGENPINIKKKIAFNITETYTSKEEAEKAQKDFENKFQKRKLEDIDYIEVEISSEKNLVELIANLLKKSKSEVRKLFEAGAVSIDGEKIFDINLEIKTIKKETILKVGKLNYFKFK
ncbi:MAG: tyrosine--tRNA ligase [Candidatus Pacebacteria bacterium]|nr:tyrosine--tRNA ligase [Candidatus Paceibacterota bacterium]MDD4333545.1 tyrosine--tRNA ligase [Candidatus Paceibacterota bacterium]